MVAVPTDHLVRHRQHVGGVLARVADLFVDGKFLPHHQAQTVRGFDGRRVVRVVRSPPEIRPHGADDLHVQGVARIRKRVSHAGVDLVPVRSLHLYPLSVQEKPSLRVELEPAKTQRVFDLVNHADPARKLERRR